MTELSDERDPRAQRAADTISGHLRQIDENNAEIERLDYKRDGVDSEHEPHRDGELTAEMDTLARANEEEEHWIRIEWEKARLAGYAPELTSLLYGPR